MSERICPECMRETDAAVCPHDGWGTVPAARYRSVESLVGQVFDKKFRVDAVIGSGGMGTVFRATQLTVDRPVALKVLRQELAGSLDQVRRFQNEARAASRLSHPNSIRLFDFGQTDNGELFLVMELLEGEALSAALRRQRHFSVKRAVSIASQTLKALAEAHDNGIVHRDLKPDNIFLTLVRGEQDFVKVLDFGIAKVALGDGEGADLQTLTKTGMVMGTPTYMAPEQAAGRGVDARSDLYAMGVILFQLLSGRVPFQDPTPLGVLMHHLRTPPPRLADLAPQSVPPALCAVVAACLDKDPERRPQTADALRVALEQAVEGAPTVAESDVPTRMLAATPQPHTGPDMDLTTIGAPGTEFEPATETASGVTGMSAITGQRRRWAWVAAALTVGLAAAVVATTMPSPEAPDGAASPATVAAATSERRADRDDRDDLAPAAGEPRDREGAESNAAVGPIEEREGGAGPAEPSRPQDTKTGAAGTPLSRPVPARRTPEDATGVRERRAPEMTPATRGTHGTRSGKPPRPTKGKPNPTTPVVRIKKM